MRRMGVMLALSGAAMWLSGCGNQGTAPQAATAPKGGMAVVDLDAIAQSLGQTQRIKDAVTMRQNAVNQQLVKLQEGYREQLAAKQSELGEEATEEQKQQLARMTNIAGQQLGAAKQRGEQALTAYSREAISKVAADLRAEIRPICQEIAAKRGLGIVVPKNEGFLLSVDPGVDITAEVLEALKARRPAAPAVAAPAAAAVAAPMPSDDATAAQPAPAGEERQ
ncbi:OmpH family outer membrane protein [Planctellipticum variicoloris]|uniref:OmpH family outer membrane protein n=1 Tax=Planctellipticum variicoloris TaxID=3064265 RepID=UPI00301352ED|nr:OmpH family outer membrane protein [Planctomycetaceae bacterium SH412]